MKTFALGLTKGWPSLVGCFFNMAYISIGFVVAEAVRVVPGLVRSLLLELNLRAEVRDVDTGRSGSVVKL